MFYRFYVSVSKLKHKRNWNRFTLKYLNSKYNTVTITKLYTEFVTFEETLNSRMADLATKKKKKNRKSLLKMSAMILTNNYWKMIDATFKS